MLTPDKLICEYFANQGVDFPLFDLEVHPGVGYYAGEPLGDVVHFKICHSDPG